MGRPRRDFEMREYIRRVRGWGSVFKGRGVGAGDEEVKKLVCLYRIFLTPSLFFNSFLTFPPIPPAVYPCSAPPRSHLSVRPFFRAGHAFPCPGAGTIIPEGGHSLAVDRKKNSDPLPLKVR